MIYLENSGGKEGYETFKKIHNYLIEKGAILEDDGYANEYSFENECVIDLKEPLKKMFPNVKVKIMIDDMYVYKEADLNIEIK